MTNMKHDLNRAEAIQWCISVGASFDESKDDYRFSTPPQGWGWYRGADGRLELGAIFTLTEEEYMEPITWEEVQRVKSTPST